MQCDLYWSLPSPNKIVISDCWLNKCDRCYYVDLVVLNRFGYSAVANDTGENLQHVFLVWLKIFSASLLGVSQTIPGTFIFVSHSVIFVLLPSGKSRVFRLCLLSQLSVFFPDALCSELGHMQFCSDTIVLLCENRSPSTCFLCIFSPMTTKRCTKI